MSKPGVYYYLWHDRIMNNPSVEIARDLDAIRETGFGWVIVDMQPSLLESYEGRYLAAAYILVKELVARNMTIMPILNIGSGMIPEVWFENYPKALALRPDGKPAITEATGPTISYYSCEALSYLKEHIKRVREIVWPAIHLSKNGRAVVEVMEDVGYPRNEETDFGVFAPKCHAPKSRIVAEFCSHLCREARVCFSGTAGLSAIALLKTFRDADPFHLRKEAMGLDYELLVDVSDGLIETVAPGSPNSPEDPYLKVERGLNFQADLCRGKYRIGVVLMEREHFDPARHLSILLQNPPDEIAVFNWNERITVDCELGRDHQIRAHVQNLVAAL